MALDESTFRRINMLDLETYCGNTDVIWTVDDELLCERLYCTSVIVSKVEPPPSYHQNLHNIIIQCTKQREYSTFIDLRRNVMYQLSKMAKAPAWNMLTVLLGGVYVGDPEDLRNFLRDQRAEPLYSIEGFAQKVAGIIFLE